MKGYPTLFSDVIFIEAEVEEGEKISVIKSDLRGVGAQLKSLNDVKFNLAEKARALGCNCVSEFQYGQKSRWLAIDDVFHYGNGLAVRLPLSKYQEIVEYMSSRDSQ